MDLFQKRSTDSNSVADDELENALLLSGLQHLAFCPRQWALIHLEQAWKENRLTAEGRLLHQAVDCPGESRRTSVRVVRGLALHSRRLRITGRCDVVEFRPEPYPVEYKRGRSKPTDCDLVQLCAQAICLEEMLQTRIARGAIFYGQPHRRQEVEFTAELRTRTENLCAEMHKLYLCGETPAVQPGSHCQSCSLADICLPWATSRQRVGARWTDACLRSLCLREEA
ncbi:MAG: CRISPR-associated protein Cas4 [Acidobacteria bacterium]|nr:MAG: CRISPR-associated protein Cas4 [Acidobacteriota bacterium]